MMKGFVVFDDNRCSGNFHKLEHAHQHILQLLEFCYRNGGVPDFKSFKIVEYCMHIVNETYELDEKFRVINTNGEVCDMDGRHSVSLIKKITRCQDSSTDSDSSTSNASDINLFIPFSSEKCNNIVQQEPVKKEETITLEELEKRMEYLTKLKEREMMDIDEAREQYEKKEEEYREEKAKLEQMKLEMKRSQEKYEEIQKKFEADKKLYFIFKQEILDGKRAAHDIPILFNDTFPVFKQLDQEQKLNTDDEIKYYLDLSQYQYNKTNYFISDFDDLFNSD